jgi:2-polyprenyl-3-methyl-5-hydroxy-6-metoxy-1,4-benzoquinol methylase
MAVARADAEPAPPAELIDPSIPEIATQPAGACPVCRSSATVPFAWGYDYELATCRNRWIFRECSACGHVLLDPRPRDDTLGVIYPPHYYSYVFAERVNPVARKAKEILDGFKFRGILRHLGRLPSNYLDIGCGDGRYLRHLEKRLGLARDRLWGLELSEKVVASLRAQGYQAINTTIEACDSVPAHSIDLMTMFHVIEHLPNPARALEKMADWITPGGIVAIETPNFDALDAKLFRRTYWGGYHIPRHWHLFRSRTLTRLLEDHGFRVVKLSYQTGHSFWMYSFHHLLRYGRLHSKRLSALFDPMGGGVLFLAGFTALDKLRVFLRFRTSSVLAIARRQ